MLLRSGVSAHNVVKHGRNAMTLTLRDSDLDAARDAAEETGCELRIVKRGGLPVLAESLKARAALFAFLFAALLALILLSGRVLAVRITSNDDALSESVRETLEASGIRVLMPKSALDAKQISEKLELSDPRIAAASVKCEGVLLLVDIEPAGTPVEPADGRPCSIYADKDCVIRKIAATDGREEVCVGEAVKKGQLLVSGDITPEGSDDTLWTHASAEIIGEVAYRFTVTVPERAPAPARSGNSAEIVRIVCFGKVFETDPGFADFEAEFKSAAYLDASIVPVKVIRGTAYELVLMNTRRSEEAMLEEALRLSEEKLRLTIPSSARMISKTTQTVRRDDGSLELIVSVLTIEKIGYKRYL